MKYRRENGDAIERMVRDQSITLTNLPPLTTYTGFSLQAVVDDVMSEPYVYPRSVRTSKLKCIKLSQKM